MQARAPPVSIDDDHPLAAGGELARQGGNHDGLAFRRRGGAEQQALGRCVRFGQLNAHEQPPQSLAVRQAGSPRTFWATVRRRTRGTMVSTGSPVMASTCSCRRRRYECRLPAAAPRLTPTRSASIDPRSTTRPWGESSACRAALRGRQQLGACLQHIGRAGRLLGTAEHRLQQVAVHGQPIALQRLERQIDLSLTAPMLPFRASNCCARPAWCACAVLVSRASPSTILAVSAATRPEGLPPRRGCP